MSIYANGRRLKERGNQTDTRWFVLLHQSRVLNSYGTLAVLTSLRVM
jgi:hypothetical protein